MKIVRPCAVALLAFAVSVVEVVAGSTEPARVRVALFADGKGPDGGYLRGTSGAGAHVWARRLDASPDAELTVVDGADVRAGALDRCDVLVMPGGSGFGVYHALREEGVAQVKAFIHRGGGYVGTCCGLACILNEKNRIPLLPYKRTLNRHRGGACPLISFNARAAELLGIPEGTMRIRYHNGPIPMPADPVPGVTCEVLATLADDLWPRPGDLGPARGTPSALFATYGRGRIFAINCHPEFSSDTVKVLEGAFRAVCGRKVSLPLPVKGPQAKKTPFVCTDCTKASVAQVLALDRDPNVDLQCVNKSDLKKPPATGD